MLKIRQAHIHIHYIHIHSRLHSSPAWGCHLSHIRHIFTRHPRVYMNKSPPYFQRAFQNVTFICSLVSFGNVTIIYSSIHTFIHSLVTFENVAPIQHISFSHSLVTFENDICWIGATSLFMLNVYVGDKRWGLQTWQKVRTANVAPIQHIVTFAVLTFCHPRTNSTWTMSVWRYLCMHICIYVYMYWYVSAHALKYVFVLFLYLCICTYAFTSVCLIQCVSMNLSIYVHGCVSLSLSLQTCPYWSHTLLAKKNNSGSALASAVSADIFRRLVWKCRCIAARAHG